MVVGVGRVSLVRRSEPLEFGTGKVSSSGIPCTKCSEDTILVPPLARSKSNRSGQSDEVPARYC